MDPSHVNKSVTYTTSKCMFSTDCGSNAHGLKYCPTHKCHNRSCSNLVRASDGKLNYYCDDHMNCGNDNGDQKPCEGCLGTFQEDDKKIKDCK